MAFRVTFRQSVVVGIRIVALENRPLTIASDGQEILVVGRKAKTRDGQGVCGQRRFEFVPFFCFEESDDGVVDGAGFAGGGDDGAIVGGGERGDFVAVAVEFFGFRPERVAGEMVFERGGGEVEGGFVHDGCGVYGVAVAVVGLRDDLVVGDGFDGFVGEA